MASVVIDGAANQLKLGGGTWTTIAATRFFGGSATWPAFASNADGDTGQYGSLSMTFQGTSITFFGNTPALPASQWVFASIDGGNTHNTSYDDPSPPSSLQWYQSPILSDGSHTVNLSRIAGTSVDFMVVTAGPTTPLQNQRLIVDDDDSDIIYKGSWTRSTGRYTSSTDPHQGLPYHNTTHQAVTSGPSATFRFSGTSVAIYSLFDFSSPGALSVSYTMDGFPVTQSYNVDSGTPAFQQGAKTIENTLMFSNDSLASGNHTLVIEVVNCINQFFALDYILYSPSFNTLAGKPNYGGITTSSSAPSTSTLAGNPGTSSTSSAAKSAPVGAIVGGVVGGIAALLLALFVVLCRKRLFNRHSSPSVSAAAKLQSPTIEPYVIPAANQHLSTRSSSPTPQHKPSNPGRWISHGDPGAGSDSGSMSGSSTVPLMIQKPSFSPTSVPISQPREQSQILNTGGGESALVGVMFRNRMQRLQGLVLELNREIAESGEESPRVVELRGRIAELTREDAQSSDIVTQGRNNTMAIPPPYEAAEARI